MEKNITVPTNEGFIRICIKDEDYFSVVGYSYIKDKGSLHTESGGAIHEEILKYRPDLKPLIDMHLSNPLGEPLNAIDNGYYWLKEGIKTLDFTTFKKYLRLTDDDVEQFKDATSKVSFCEIYFKLELPKRHLLQAIEATNLLKSL